MILEVLLIIYLTYVISSKVSTDLLSTSGVFINDLFCIHVYVLWLAYAYTLIYIYNYI